jgi:hypothetical protein
MMEVLRAFYGRAYYHDIAAAYSLRDGVEVSMQLPVPDLPASSMPFHGIADSSRVTHFSANVLHESARLYSTDKLPGGKLPERPFPDVYEVCVGGGGGGGG